MMEERYYCRNSDTKSYRELVMYIQKSKRVSPALLCRASIHLRRVGCGQLTNQHCTIRWYTPLGQPGGGTWQYPLLKAVTI